MAEHDAHLAKAYLRKLMRDWPPDGRIRRPARDWRLAAIAFLALGSCAGAGPQDMPDAEEVEAGTTDAADADALADVLVDMSSDEPTSIAMYAAPGCGISRKKTGGSAGPGLLLVAAAASLGLRRRKGGKRR
jgi:hypothetical protein